MVGEINNMFYEMGTAPIVEESNPTLRSIPTGEAVSLQDIPRRPPCTGHLPSPASSAGRNTFSNTTEVSTARSIASYSTDGPTGFNGSQGRSGSQEYNWHMCHTWSLSLCVALFFGFDVHLGTYYRISYAKGFYSCYGYEWHYDLNECIPVVMVISEFTVRIPMHREYFQRHKTVILLILVEL